MNVAQFRREKEYGAALSLAGNLLKRNLITQYEYHKVKTALISKYRPVIGSLQKNAPNNSPRNR